MRFEDIGLVENEFDIGCERNDGPLVAANEIVEWLKMNKPDNEDEIDALTRMVIGFKMDDDLSEGYYGIREVYGQRLIFGPRNMLFLNDDVMVHYFLDVLEGLRSEMMAASFTTVAA